MATYPLRTQSADAQESLTVGDVLVSKIETRYIDSADTLREVSVELSSSYAEDNLISYTFTRQPADLVLALGGLTQSPAGERIITSLSADVGRLEDFLSTDDLNKLPVAFAKEEFLIVPPFSELPEHILVEANPTKMVVVPVAILNKDFEPIVSNAATFFMP